MIIDPFLDIMVYMVPAVKIASNGRTFSTAFVMLDYLSTISGISILPRFGIRSFSCLNNFSCVVVNLRSCIRKASGITGEFSK